MKKLFIILAITMCLTGCSESTLNKIENSDITNSTWIWNVENMNLQTIKNLNDTKIKEIYLNVGWSPEKNENYFENNPLKYNSFINNLKSYNIETQALLSNNDWTLKENYQDFENQVSNILNYNKKYKNRFKGIHLDIESYLLENFENNSEIYFQSYLENLKKIKELINQHNTQNKDNIILSIDIPFWYSQKTINNNNLIDELLNVVDEITIMNYTKNNDDFINRGKEILNIAKNYSNKKVKMGIELNETEEDISLKNLSFEEILNFLDKSLIEFETYENFDGFSIHDYNAFINYLNQ